ncbi:DUF4153 domain-containing protein [Nocardiopsis algeriensis]|uniref:DUF4153 domain-containing protein n=1 Tax=Nocardiopsis algeriensis TaxID=1478215 RepID=UPI003B432FC1
MPPSPPLPPAPAWLLPAALGVGVLALLLATLIRPGLGLVITGLAAGLTALAALLTGPREPRRQDSPAAEAAEAGGEDTPEERPDSSEETPERTSDSPRTAEEAEGKNVPGEDASSSGGRPGAAPAGAAPPSRAPAQEVHGPDFWSGHRYVWEEDPATPGKGSAAWSAVFGGLAAALLLTAALLDAGWVLFWTLTGAFLLTSLAFAVRGPAFHRGTLGVLSGVLALPANIPAAPGFALRPLSGSKTRAVALPALVTAVVTALLLFVFGLLFASADAVFAGYLEQAFISVFGELSFTSALGRVFALVLFTLLTVSAVLSARRRRVRKRILDQSEPPVLPVWTWAVPLVSLLLLFTAFVGVQATTLFGGDEYVQQVTGVTYAEYARQGFFQLVFISLLVLGVVALCVWILPRPGSLLLRNALLGLLCVLTLVILSSAWTRLQLYIDAFGLTRLRATSEAWIALSAGVFVLLLLAGLLNTLGRSSDWLPRAVVALAGVSLAVFAYGNPDLRIAESMRGLEASELDTGYLIGLSTDAVPGLLELEGPGSECSLLLLRERLLGDDDGLAGWNLSRERARVLFEEEGVLGASPYEKYGSCIYHDRTY